MHVRLPVTAIFTALILLTSGCSDDEESDPASSSPISREVQVAIDRLQAAAQQQMRAVEQARQANNYAQLQQAISQQEQAEQQAQPYVQTLQEAQSDQAVVDYLEDRTSANQEWTQILKDQAQEAAENAQYDEAQRVEELYQEHREEAQREEQQANGY